MSSSLNIFFPSSPPFLSKPSLNPNLPCKTLDPPWPSSTSRAVSALHLLFQSPNPAPKISPLWLFPSAFSNSPNLVPLILLLVSGFVGWQFGELGSWYERIVSGGERSSLVLANYAQFLYGFSRDYDRAEKYFKWALKVDPMDAEAASRYAFFLWEVRGDLERAEEMFLQAIDAEPRSYYHSGNYAWFLWKTGAEDTCFPLSTLSNATTY